MIEEDDDEACDCPPGLPAYLATFADLMSLLMCFFVLLLAFSEMDVQKYRQVAGSLKMAFGVQAEVKARETPKGTSIIAQEFSPGRPDPTVLNVVQQHTIDQLQSTLDVMCAEGESEAREASDEEVSQEAAKRIMQQLIAQTQADAVQVAAELKEDIQNGKVEVETVGRKIVIRVKEKGSFASGSATLRPDFIPIMDKIRGAIKDMDGEFAVAGHTDDVPISTPRFRSNWELSSARAVSVAHELMKTEEMAPDRFVVVGHGETRPQVPNDNDENRTQNRRVEIVIEQGKEDEEILKGEKELPEDEEFNLDMLRAAGLEDLEGFKILLDPELQEDVEAPQGSRVISVLETPTPAPTPERTPSPAPTTLPTREAVPDPTPTQRVRLEDLETLLIETEAQNGTQVTPVPTRRPSPTLTPRPAPTPTRPAPPSSFDPGTDPFGPPVQPAEDEFF